MVKSLGAVVVVLLGVAWFLLDALGPPTNGTAQAADPGSSVMAPVAKASSGDRPGPVSLRPEVPTEVPAAPVVSSTEEAEPQPEPATDPVPVTPPPAGPANGSAAAESGRALQAVFQQVEALKAQGDLMGAEAVLRKTIAEATAPADAARAGLVLASVTSDPAERRELYTKAFVHGVVIGPEYEEIGVALRELNTDPGSSLVPHLTVDRYEVESGDSLWALCNRTFPEAFGVQPEVGLVRLVNGMRGDTLRVGQTLLVPHDELIIVVAARHHGLVAYLGDVVLMSYRVGLGKQNRTPHGEFTVQVKQENPSWWKDGQVVPFGDPENVLGTRWMGFENRPGTTGYGIHGTAEPSSIGKDMSMGCVRMRNEEIQELFEYVPRGTRVHIQ